MKFGKIRVPYMRFFPVNHINKGIVLKKLFNVVIAALLIAGLSTAWAEAGDGKPGMTAEQFLASLNFQNGKIDLPGGIAGLDLPPTFRYLNPADTNRVLVDAWRNPPGGTTLGMIV